MSWQALVVLGVCAAVVAVVLGASNADAQRDSDSPMWWVGWLILAIAVASFVGAALVAWPAA